MTTSVFSDIPGVQPSAASPTLFYTSPVSTTTITFLLLMINTDLSVGTTYTIWRIPFGGTAPVSGTDQPQNMIAYVQPINPVERQSIGDRFVLLTGDTLYIYATLGTITFHASLLLQS